MFYYLWLLYQENPFFNIFRYITFRAASSFLTSFFMVLFLGPLFIRTMIRLQKGGQPIRSDGPESHISKKGTPTMGGLLILGTFFISFLLWGRFHNPYVWLCCYTLIAYGVLGFLDDYLKLLKKNSKGLSQGQKMICQCFIASISVIFLAALEPENIRYFLFFPFLKNTSVFLSFLYPLFGILVIVGSSNAVNLTDGLDGLAVVPLMISITIMGIFAYILGHYEFSHYLHYPFMPYASELIVLCSALVGASLGFLWYNAPPARMFMGDVGSLSTGAFLGIMALILKQEILLLIIGGIFVIETLSVIIQIAYWKKKKRRFFAMAPLHHHFEKKGWSESTIVLRFWIVAFLFGLLSLMTLKLR